MADIAIPDGGSFRVSRARVPVSLAPARLEADADGLALADIEIADGRFGSITPSDGASPVSAIDLAGRIVLPAFVDCHTHIDKGHIWARQPNPDGTFLGALNASGEDRAANWNAADLTRRMDFALRCAFAHGTKAVRTHLDSVPPQEDISWPVFEEMRERWRGRVELQGACLFGIEEARDTAWLDKMVKQVAAAGGVLGAVTYMVPDLKPLLERMFAHASNHGLDLDFHADETHDTEAISLRLIAEAAMRHKFQGK